MGDHFAAFSFVDRITFIEPGVRARGSFAIPATLDAFPSCLVAEAVGQLAAWVAMAAIDFRGRPVAALANETRFFCGATPGMCVDLAVEVESCDDEAVAYGGLAAIDGEPVVELIDCLGPMLPVAEFDDPLVLADRFALLCDTGAAPGRFGGVPFLRAARADDPCAGSATGPTGTGIGSLQVPAAAAFFHDHFPRRPVFPATLLLDAQIALAMDVAREAACWPDDMPIAPLRMTRVKVRSFTPPGQLLTIAATMKSLTDGVGTFALTAEADGRRVASASVDIGPGKLQ